MKASAPARSLHDPAAEIEDMILNLMELRRAETSRERADHYQGAIDRLDELAYWLKTATTPDRRGVLPRRPAPLQQTRRRRAFRKVQYRSVR